MYANAEPCYVVINAPMLNYADAAANCKSLGGSLARIKSNAENTFVGNLMVKKYKFENKKVARGMDFSDCESHNWWIVVRSNNKKRSGNLFRFNVFAFDPTS